MRTLVTLSILVLIVTTAGLGACAIGRHVHPAGFRVHYVGAAEEPWVGLDAAREVLEALPPLAKLRCVDLIVYGPDETIPGNVTPGRRLTGLTSRKCTAGACCYTVHVLQLADVDGEIRPACDSAFHHEFVEHVYSIETTGDENIGHTNAELTAKGRDLQEMCRVVVAARDPQD